MDIGSSFQPLALPKSQAGVVIACPNCKAHNSLRNSLKELPCSLETDLIEVVSICPDCGHVKHIYYMSKELRSEQIQLGVKIKVLARRATQENLNKVIELRENYKKLFDAEQRKFLDLSEKKDE